MKKYLLSLSFILLVLTSCRQGKTPAQDEVRKITPEMAKVRDYIPQNAVLAHRGTTHWAPEETEAAFRWARNTGADYLEADLQTSKDAVLLALHDENLRRTTNIEEVFADKFPEKQRRQYYGRLGFKKEEIEEKIEADKESFKPYLPSSYTYVELMELDCAKWFNTENKDRARDFKKQFASTLEDLVQISKGWMIKRDADANKRVYSIERDENQRVIYKFEYEKDPQDNGNRPGIYIEFKEPKLNIEGFERLVFDELDRLEMNIVTKREKDDAPAYVDGKVNVGRTNAKVVLQTFSKESLVNIKNIFKGEIPVCFLLWKGQGEGDLRDGNREEYTSFINFAVDNLAHFIGPSIEPELLEPWQGELIRRSEMKIHPYSFDTKEQMEKFYKTTYQGKEIQLCDAMFTNRSEITLKFYIDQRVRKYPAPEKVEDAEKVLNVLGYTK